LAANWYTEKKVTYILGKYLRVLILLCKCNISFKQDKMAAVILAHGGAGEMSDLRAAQKVGFIYNYSP
jgi:hypothetical protein